MPEQVPSLLVKRLGFTRDIDRFDLYMGQLMSCRLTPGIPLLLTGEKSAPAAVPLYDKLRAQIRLLSTNNGIYIYIYICI